MWDVITTDKFDEWFDDLSDIDRANIIAGMLLLKEKGPSLSRPYADTVEDSHCIDCVQEINLKMINSFTNV